MGSGDVWGRFGFYSLGLGLRVFHFSLKVLGSGGLGLRLFTFGFWGFGPPVRGFGFALNSSSFFQALLNSSWLAVRGVSDIGFRIWDVGLRMWV